MDRILTAGSLFSGVGGIDLAFALAGFDIRYQVEINPLSRRVLKKHAQHYWRNAIHFTDVQQCGNGRACELPHVDALFGGFPCQDISDAGKRKGIREGNRSGLWYEFKRIIGDVRPRVVFLENVAAIVREDRGGTDVLAHLAEMGYVGFTGTLFAADAGAPHQRERWFCVGYSGSLGHPGQESTRQPHRHEKWNNPTGLRGWSEQLPASVSDGQVGNPQSIGNQRNTGELEKAAGDTQEQINGRSAERSGQDGRRNARPFKSRLDRNTDGLSCRMDSAELMSYLFPACRNEQQFPSEPSRTTRCWNEIQESRIEMLGNAVVPQVVYPIAKLLHEVLTA